MYDGGIGGHWERQRPVGWCHPTRVTPRRDAQGGRGGRRDGSDGLAGPAQQRDAQLQVRTFAVWSVHPNGPSGLVARVDHQAGQRGLSARRSRGWRRRRRVPACGPFFSGNGRELTLLVARCKAIVVIGIGLGGVFRSKSVQRFIQRLVLVVAMGERAGLGVGQIGDTSQAWQLSRALVVFAVVAVARVGIHGCVLKDSPTFGGKKLVKAAVRQWKGSSPDGA